MSEAVQPPPTERRRLRSYLAPRIRTWVLTVPLHLLAFVVLYVATAKIMEREISSLASDSAVERLELIARRMNEIALAHAGGDGGHLFQALIASQREINLQLFLPGGSFMGPGARISAADHQRLIEFLRGEETREVWVRSEEGSERLRGLRRITAESACLPCHQLGDTLAVATISTDLTGILTRVRAHSRRNLGILIVAWAALLGMINLAVRRSVRRSAARLEADLAAAESGQPPLGERTEELVLDPSAARLHGALSEFLGRQRQRQEEMESALEHSDQLASLGRLAVGLAHEIKNPLAGIQGALEILREDSAQQQTTRLYDDMLEELRRVNTTLQLLLESARPSPPKLAPTDPIRLVTDAVHLLRPVLSRRGISLRYEIAADIGEVDVDAVKIRQVLINLIQNAAEAMDGEGSIIVRAGSFPENREGLILAVEDDGPGISEEHRARIFEPFYTTKFSGTGLGLAISKRLVEQHGGSLEVDSEPGRTTIFYVLLPSPESLEADAAVTVGASE